MNKKYDNPILSVIVPVFNVEMYLKRCVDSIINQDLKDLEIILVNDGSLDNSGTICDEYAKIDNRVKVIHKKNMGLGAARNSGLKLAKGKYVGFVDSDDWITKDMYSFLIDLAIKHNADIVSSSYILTCGDNEIKQKEYYIKCFEGNEKIRFYLEHGMKYRVSDYSVCNKVYQKKLFDTIQFPEGQLYEDGVTNLKLINGANRYVKSDKITYYYFQEGNSITRNGFTKKDYDLLLIGKQMVEFANSKKDERIIELAMMKEARSYFSMLSKIAMYGFASEVEDKSCIVSELTHNLRHKYFLLMRSPMPLNRKIIMSLLCIHINMVRIPLRILKIVKI